MAGIGKALRDQHPEVDWPAGARTLDTQLGKLDKGDVVWWRNHPVQAQCLAQLLDVEMADLGLAAHQASYLLEFPEFPGMPALDLRQETTWRFGAEKYVAGPEGSGVLRSLEQWLSPPAWQQRPPYELNWLCIRDDFERRLLAQQLRASGHYELVFSDTLTNASERLASSKPLIVVVDRQDGDADFNALAMRPEGVGALVICPYGLPVRADAGDDEFFSWERRALEGRERVVADLSTASGFQTVLRWSWERFPDWRMRFLVCLERHLDKAENGSLYSAKGVHDWLALFDPMVEWFPTVGDLLSLCMAYESEKRLPKEYDAQAGQALLAALHRRQPKLALQPLTELCTARWQQGAVDWNGALSLQAWIQLVPNGPVVLGEDDLAPIVKGKTAAQRRREAEALRLRLQRAHPQYWLESGVLAPVAGGYDFRHRSLVNLLMRDSVLKDIQGASFGRWAGACFDAGRCRLVDAALDALPLDQMQSLISRVAEADPESCDSIGTSEAVFLAVGRRIARGERLPDWAVLTPLAQIVMARLDMNAAGWSLPAPWSRSVDTQREQLEWISACWSWSSMPKPGYLVDSNWLFPGWGDVMPEPPDWLTALWPEKSTEQLPAWWQLFFKIAGDWIKELEAPMHAVPRFLRMAHLAKAARGAWVAESAWWDGLVDSHNQPWIDAVLIEGFAAAAAADAARRLCASYLQWEAQAPKGVEAWTRYASRNRRWLLQSLPADWSIDSLSIANRVYLASCPLTLPPRLRGALLLSLRELGDSTPIGGEAQFLRRFGAGIVTELEQLLRQEVWCWAVAELIWEWSPERARALLEPTSGLTQLAWGYLLDACPAASLPVALDALRADLHKFADADRNAWIRKRLPASGSLARPLLALLVNP